MAEAGKPSALKFHNWFYRRMMGYFSLINYFQLVLLSEKKRSYDKNLEHLLSIYFILYL
jgi:hypothetical protein